MIENPFLGVGLNDVSLAEIPMPSVDATAPNKLLERCPEAGPTPLVALGSFACAGSVFVKDERDRMGLES